MIEFMVALIEVALTIGWIYVQLWSQLYPQFPSNARCDYSHPYDAILSRFNTQHTNRSHKVYTVSQLLKLRYSGSRSLIRLGMAKDVSEIRMAIVLRKSHLDLTIANLPASNPATDIIPTTAATTATTASTTARAIPHGAAEHLHIAKWLDEEQDTRDVSMSVLKLRSLMRSPNADNNFFHYCILLTSCTKWQRFMQTNQKVALEFAHDLAYYLPHPYPHNPLSPQSPQDPLSTIVNCIAQIKHIKNDSTLEILLSTLSIVSWRIQSYHEAQQVLDLASNLALDYNVHKVAPLAIILQMGPARKHLNEQMCKTVQDLVKTSGLII